MLQIYLDNNYLYGSFRIRGQEGRESQRRNLMIFNVPYLVVFLQHEFFKDFNKI